MGGRRGEPTHTRAQLGLHTSPVVTTHARIHAHSLAGEAEPMENGVDDHSQLPPQVNGIDSQHPTEKPVQPEKTVRKIRVTYEEYRTIANLLILHLRQVEETSVEGGRGIHTLS